MPRRSLTNILQGQASVCGYVDKEHRLAPVPLKGDVLFSIEGQRPVVVDGVLHRVVALHLWGEEHPVGAGWGLPAILLPMPGAGRAMGPALLRGRCQRCVPCPECRWQQPGAGVPRSRRWDRLPGACGCTWLWLQLGSVYRTGSSGKARGCKTAGGQRQNPEAVGE